MYVICIFIIDHALHPYSTPGSIFILCILISKFLERSRDVFGLKNKKNFLLYVYILFHPEYNFYVIKEPKHLKVFAFSFTPYFHVLSFPCVY